MRGGKFFLCTLLAVAQAFSVVNIASAVTLNGLVISHVITGESSSSSSEFIAVYNNANHDIDMTGYCIKNKIFISVACISADENTKVFIRSNNYLTFASTVFAAAHSYIPDTSYASSNSFQVGGDIVSLVDASGIEVDRATWGTSGGSISSTTNGTLYRKQDSALPGQLIDTDVMQNDFSNVSNSLIYPPNASYDQVTIIDICPNIVDIQTVMPTGYLLDDNGNCQPDSCVNIPGLQTSVPDNYDADGSGNCVPHDECDNVSGVQFSIPANMVRKSVNDCVWDIAPIVLNELLPNAIGTDTGNEFIEIYNPTNRTIDLSLYSVAIGIASDKIYAFPIGSTIAPGEYRVFSDSLMKFTLVNTSSRVVLRAIDNSILGDSGMYDSPVEGSSWAFIDGVWQFTNRPTPNAENMSSMVQPDSTTDPSEASAAPCPAGKYRNPLTNRCRSIANDASVLASCDSDEYRNPETGRCKKIQTSSLTPCKDGQYRSEETNRCRNIIATASQKPCKDNQYRSEETGRCRNLPLSQIPSADFGVQPVRDSAMAFVGWGALCGVLSIAAMYGIWEWRHELRHVARKIIKKRD